MLFRNKFLVLVSATALLATACAPQTDSSATQASVPSEAQTSVSFSPLNYAFSDVLTCLPEDQAIIAAHRGTSRAWDIPENSLEALRRLIDEGTLIAELDIAGLKSGEQILYHDGSWDRKSTGTGPVASSTYTDIDKILLKSFAGTLSAERPPLLSDALKLSKDKIFLEIDFKSSAKTEEVLSLIRENGMEDQVVLIAYTQERAEELHALAPEMLLSAPGKAKGLNLTSEKTLLWMGSDVDKATEPTDTLGYIGLIGRDDAPKMKAKHAVFLVSDYPTEQPQIVGEGNKALFQDCLKAK